MLFTLRNLKKLINLYIYFFFIVGLFSQSGEVVYKVEMIKVDASNLASNDSVS
jgi:hypothetical protein